MLFVENREKTYFWEHVALRLEALGHRIAWLVQNPQFTPHAYRNSPDLHVIPLPRRPGARQRQQHTEEWVKEHYPGLLPDRGRLYHNCGAAHYEWYTNRIQR